MAVTEGIDIFPLPYPAIHDVWDAIYVSRWGRRRRLMWILSDASSDTARILEMKWDLPVGRDSNIRKRSMVV